MTKKEGRENILSSFQKSNTKQNKLARSSLIAAWNESDQLGHENVFLENQLSNAQKEIKRLKNGNC